MISGLWPCCTAEYSVRSRKQMKSRSLHHLGTYTSGNTIWATGLYRLNQVTARQVCQRLQQVCRLGLQKINLCLVNWSATRDKNTGLTNDALFIWRRASQGKQLLPCPTQKDKIVLAEYFWAHKAFKSQWSQYPTGRPLDSWKLLDIRIVTCIRAVPRALLATRTNEARLMHSFKFLYLKGTMESQRSWCKPQVHKATAFGVTCFSSVHRRER